MTENEAIGLLAIIGRLGLALKQTEAQLVEVIEERDKLLEAVVDSSEK